jgi:hypothetical protein
MADDLRAVSSDSPSDDEMAESSSSALNAPQPSVVRQHVLDLVTQWKGKHTYLLYLSISLSLSLFLSV